MQTVHFMIMWHEKFPEKFGLCLNDPVGSEPFGSDLDPDVWDRIRIRFRIRILALINYTTAFELFWHV
jgi:hypothetical protein